MRKSDGTYTYFLPDVAYHVTKWKRGFHRAIDVQGADHHSTVTRVRAGLQALEIGIPAGYPEYVLHQMVTVMKHGEEVKISKRAGSYVTVRDLINEVGRDAVRYFFLMRKSDSQLIFNVDLARSQSEENPVYYIQMAHARMCGIFRVGEIDAGTITADGVRWECLGRARGARTDQAAARLAEARAGRRRRARAAPRRDLPARDRAAGAPVVPQASRARRAGRHHAREAGAGEVGANRDRERAGGARDFCAGEDVRTTRRWKMEDGRSNIANQRQ